MFKDWGDQKAMKLLIAALFAASVAFAQVQSGRIVGTVTDPNKAVIPNATVTVTGTATNQAKTVTTNQIGEYAITPLDPGIYNVVVTVPGFQTTQVSNVEVIVGQSARVDVEMKIGETSTK